MVVGGSVPAVLLGWIGGYDAMFVIAAAVGTMMRQRSALAVGWCVMALSHSALAIAALVLWAPVVIVGRRHARIDALTAACGVLIGWAAMHVLTDSWGGSTDRLQLLERIAPSDLLRSYLHLWPVMVFSALGIGWLAVLSRPARTTAWGRPMLISALVAALGLTLVAADETRIAALALLPAGLTWARHVVPEEHVRPLARGLLLPALIVPTIVVWMGGAQYPGWPTPF